MLQLDIELDSFSMTATAGRVELFLSECSCADETLFEIRLVVEELLTNVAQYANVPRVTLCLTVTSRKILVEVIDAGTPFNPLQHDVQGLDQDFADRQIGGMGIYLVQEMMDELSYTYKDGKNILQAVKCRGN